MTQARTLEVGEQSAAKETGVGDVKKTPSSPPKSAETRSPDLAPTLPGSGSLTPHEAETAAIIEHLREGSQQSSYSTKSGQDASSGVKPETKTKEDEEATSEAGSYSYSDAFDPITPQHSFTKSRDVSFVTSVASDKTKDRMDSILDDGASISSASSKSSRSSHSSKSSRSSKSSKSSKSSMSSQSSDSHQSSKSGKSSSNSSISSKSSKSSQRSKDSHSSRSRKLSKSPDRSKSPLSRKSSKSPKRSKSPLSRKSSKSPKRSKSPLSRKSSKSPKRSKSPKSRKSSKSPKRSKSPKSRKSSKSPKRSKSPQSRKSSKSPKRSKSPQSRKSPKSPKTRVSPAHSKAKSPISKDDRSDSEMITPDIKETVKLVSTTAVESAETKKSSASSETRKHSAHSKGEESPKHDKEKKLVIEGAHLEPISKDLPKLDVKKLGGEGEAGASITATEEKASIPDVSLKGVPTTEPPQVSSVAGTEVITSAKISTKTTVEVTESTTKSITSAVESTSVSIKESNVIDEKTEELVCDPISLKKDKPKSAQKIEKEIEQKTQSPTIERTTSRKSDAGSVKSKKSSARSHRSGKKSDSGSSEEEGKKSVDGRSVTLKEETKVKEAKEVLGAETEVLKAKEKSSDGLKLESTDQDKISAKSESEEGSHAEEKSRVSKSGKSGGSKKSEKDYSSDSATPRPQSLASRASSRTLTPRKSCTGSPQSKPGSRVSQKTKSRQEGDVALDLNLKSPVEDYDKTKIGSRASSGHSSVISPLKPMRSPQKALNGSTKNLSGSEGFSSAGGRQALESRESERGSRVTLSRTSIASTVSARSLKSKTEYVEERKYLKSLQGDKSDYDIDLSTNSVYSKTGTPPPKSRVSDSKSKTPKASAQDDTSSSELEFEYDKRKSPGSLLSVRSKSRSKPMGMVGFELKDEVKASTSDSSDDEKVSAAVGKLSIRKQSKSPAKYESRPTSSASNKSRIMSAREYAKMSSKASSRYVSPEPEKDQDSSDHYSDIFSSDDAAKSKKSVKPTSRKSSVISSASDKTDYSKKSVKSVHSRKSKSSRASSRSSHSAAAKSIEDEFSALEQSILPDEKTEKVEVQRKDESGSSSDDSLFEAAKDSSSSESDAPKSRASSQSSSRKSKLSVVSKKLSRTSSHDSHHSAPSPASLKKSPVSSRSSNLSEPQISRTGSVSSRASSAPSKSMKSPERELSRELSRGSSKTASRASFAASDASRGSSERTYSRDSSRRSSKASTKRSSVASKSYGYSSSDSEFEAAALKSDSHYSSSESDASESSHALASRVSSHSASSKGKSVSPTSSKHSLVSKSSRASSKLSSRSSRSSKHSESRGSSAYSAHKEQSYSSDTESEKLISRALTRSALSHHSSRASSIYSGDADKYSEEEAATVPPLPPIDDKPITAVREATLPTVTIRKRPKMSRESTSIRALQIISQQLKKSKKPSAKFAASLGPYRATDHVFEYINQPERATTGVIRSRPTVLELVGIAGSGALNRTEYGIERELTAASITGIRPKVIPITEPLPPFPRLGAVSNYRSKVRGKLDYNSVPQARAIIEYERKKRQESRTQAEYEITRKSWARFQLNRLPSKNSTNHFLRAANSYFQSTGSYRAMRESVQT